MLCALTIHLFSRYSNFIFDKSVYVDLSLSTAKPLTAVNTPLLLLSVAQDVVPHNTCWIPISNGKKWRPSADFSGLMVVLPISIRRALAQVGMVELLDGSGFYELFGHLTFEQPEELD